MNNESQNILDCWVVEWSKSQQAFHVTSRNDVAESNTKRIDGQHNTDYRPIAFCRTHEEACAIVEARLRSLARAA